MINYNLEPKQARVACPDGLCTADDAKRLALEELQVPSQGPPRRILICSVNDAVSSPRGEAVDDRFPVDDVGVHRLTIPFLR